MRLGSEVLSKKPAGQLLTAVFVMWLKCCEASAKINSIDRYYLCAQDGHMRLAPKAGEQHTFHASDRLVVISGSKFES